MNDDLISRAEAIDAVYKNDHYTTIKQRLDVNSVSDCLIPKWGRWSVVRYVADLLEGIWTMDSLAKSIGSVLTEQRMPVQCYMVLAVGSLKRWGMKK